MDKSEVLEKLAKLFTLLPDPTVLESGTLLRVDSSFQLTTDITTCIKSIIEVCPSIAKYVNFESDGHDVSFADSSIDLIDTFVDKNIDKFKLSWPSRNEIPPIYFYKDEYELVDSHANLLSINKPLPELFYLTENGLISSYEKCEKLTKIERILDWFSLLVDIANTRTNSRDGTELIFIEKAGDEKLSKPIHFKTTICSEMLDIEDVPSVGHFNELRINGDENEVYKKEKQKFLRVAFIEVLRQLKINNPGISDALLIARNLDNLRNSYYEHLELFMEDFAISEFKREIEDTHFSYLEKIESVLGNIQGKLYAIPAAFIALGAISRTDTVESSLLILIAAFIASLFTFLMVKNQKYRADYIEKSIDFVFDKKERDNDSEYNDVNIIENIIKAKKSLRGMVDAKVKLIRFYSISSWLPFLAAAVVVYVRYMNEINCWLLTIVTYLNFFNF